MLFEPLVLLISATVGGIIFIRFYYVKLTKVAREYRDARGIVQTIIANFNRRMKDQSLKIEESLNTSQTAVTIASSLHERIREQAEEATSLKHSMETTLKAQTTIVKNLIATKDSLAGISKKQDLFQEQLKSLDDRYRGLLPEVDKTVMLPVAGEIALSRLTPTEIHILEVITLEGSKPAPELKEIIGKTREHTARLMKKLFNEGYVERETGNIPYRYKINDKVKPTIEQLIKKKEITAQREDNISR